MSGSIVLSNLIKNYFSKYLEKTYKPEIFNNLYSEEIGKPINEVFFKEKKIFLKINGRWHPFDDEKITNRILIDFSKELSNTRIGERFNLESPFLSTELPIPYDRYRVQCFNENILYQKEVQIVIRIPSDEKFELENFILEAPGYDYEKIRDLVRKKHNILISGGTGTGKTSLLNALLEEVDPQDRIVTIEDVKELSIKNPNKTEILISKQGNGISYETTLNLVMRSAPDRIFLGEIDTRNTLPFLRLANTGHSGMISTIHANSAKDGIQAIISNALFTANVEREVLIAFIKSAIDFIIQIQSRRTNKGENYTSERIISEVLDLKNENFYD